MNINVNTPIPSQNPYNSNAPPYINVVNNQVPPYYNPQPNPMYNGGQIYMPIQPQNNNVVTGVNTPLLINQANHSLEALECFEDLNSTSEAVMTKYVEGLFFKDTKYVISTRGTFSRNIFICKKINNSLTDKGGKSF